MQQVDDTKPIGYLAKSKPAIGVGILLIVFPFFFLGVGILMFELQLDLFWGDRLLYYGIGTAVATILSLPGIMLVQDGRKRKKIFTSMVRNGTVVQGEVVEQTQKRHYSRHRGMSHFCIKVTYMFEKPNTLLPGSRPCNDWFTFNTKDPDKAADNYKPGTFVDVLYHGENSVVLTDYT